MIYNIFVRVLLLKSNSNRIVIPTNFSNYNPDCVSQYMFHITFISVVYHILYWQPYFFLYFRLPMRKLNITIHAAFNQRVK